MALKTVKMETEKGNWGKIFYGEPHFKKWFILEREDLEIVN